MTNFVFYHPDTLEIKGQSDHNEVMDFLSVETENIIYTPNFRIEKTGEDISLVAIKNQYSDEEWEEITTPQSDNS